MDKKSFNKNRRQPLCIDLFAGAGGLTEGLAQAGFRTVWANEIDEMAATTFSFNHSNVPLIKKDIRTVDPKECLANFNLAKGKVALVCGGPPCQGFSLAGPRLSDDPRNQLFREFVRIVDQVRPDALLFENVSGITSMANGDVLSAIVEEFLKLGYSVEYRVLNAADYGVPQARPRFILVGSRDKLPIGFPPATHALADRNIDLFSEPLKPYNTVWDALGDLPQIQQGGGSEEMEHEGNYQNDYQRARRGTRKPGAIFNHRATRHSTDIIARYASIPEGGDNSQVPLELRTKKINVFKLHRSKPARTVTCNLRTDLLHPIQPRGITVREAARLQSFDDDYCFFGNLTRKARWVTQDDQVGNAVPPMLAYALGIHLRKVFRW